MRVRLATREEWIKILEDCPNATFFHSPWWYEVWRDYAGYKIETRLFEIDHHKKILLPLASKKVFKGLSKIYFSSPAGTYGGFLSKEELLAKDLKKIMNYIARFPSIEITQNLFGTIDIPLASKNDTFTQVINLESGWNFLIKNWTKGHLSAAKKSEREGVKIRRAYNLSDWKEYFLLYQDSLVRWGDSASNNYTFELFERIKALPANLCTLWLAEYDSTIISGCLCFYFNYHVVYWHGSTNSKYYYLRPVHYLQYIIIKDSIEKGFKWYDFNPSGGHLNVSRFKNGFGTEKIVLKEYHKVTSTFHSFLSKLSKYYVS
jgi:lipid II:glycine glycyltransferase (peptidoglycan interpeptide bridge formation enzyme)